MIMKYKEQGGRKKRWKDRQKNFHERKVLFFDYEGKRAPGEVEAAMRGSEGRNASLIA